jgi:hypothetical protein
MLLFYSKNRDMSYQYGHFNMTLTTSGSHFRPHPRLESARAGIETLKMRCEEVEIDAYDHAEILRSMRKESLGRGKQKYYGCGGESPVRVLNVNRSKLHVRKKKVLCIALPGMSPQFMGSARVAKLGICMCEIREGRSGPRSCGRGAIAANRDLIFLVKKKKIYDKGLKGRHWPRTRISVKIPEQQGLLPQIH